MREILIKYDLSPNQYYFLMDLYNKRPPSYKIRPEEMEDLENRSFISSIEGSMRKDALSKSLNIFEKQGDMKELFTTIWDLYPRKTPSGRNLRPTDPTSQIGKMAFKKLKSQLTIKNNYDKIIKGLKQELNERSRGRSLNFMQHITTWVNQRTWEAYDNEEESEEDSSVFDVS